MEMPLNTLYYPDLNKWERIINSPETPENFLLDCDFYHLVKDIVITTSLSKQKDTTSSKVALANQTGDKVLLNYQSVGKEDVERIFIEFATYNLRKSIQLMFNPFDLENAYRIFEFKKSYFHPDSSLTTNPALQYPLPLKGRRRYAAALWELYLDTLEQQREDIRWLYFRHSVEEDNRSTECAEKFGSSVIIYPLPESTLVN